METYGLIAGSGRFPFLVLEAARSQGISMVVAAVEGETCSEIEAAGVPVRWLGIGQLGGLIEYFRAHGVGKAVMAGQVRHVQLFSGALPDWRMVRMLARLPRKDTSSLIGAVAEELGSDGIELVDSTLFLQPLLAPAGRIAGPEPDARQRGDMAYGLSMAREIARLDLGQAVAVRDQAVVAVEAMEGTDAMIRRAGELCGPGFCVVKVARPLQDMRYDVPVVGLTTVETMLGAGAGMLVVEAGRTLLFDRQAMAARADAGGITLLGAPPA